MSLAPKFSGAKFTTASSPTTFHTLELFLDYVCPYSAKMFNTIYTSVFPLLNEKYPGKVDVIFRQQIQPWHPSSTLVHEAAVGVLQLKPEAFWDFSKALFDDSKSYYDVHIVNEKRNDTYKRLAKLGAKFGVSEDKLLQKLYVNDKPGEDGSLNIGNAVTDDLKVLVKFNRKRGVHVTPTVLTNVRFFNGIEEGGITSGFSGEEWKAWLEKNIV
ncbi:hypothetical protein BJ878DRAFT_579149 [Calycina marina]|uniref:Thioredoxin-like fold domain-containing protein n=1 Tax=Calycina marina TaxID=1763456 RepID=A0A9P7YV70_9HELO|nr:hypothetical protein BJ878DRAFT_579149 [Calycina marina]